MIDGTSVFMSKDTKARMLLMTAWVSFWRRHTHAEAELTFAVTDDEMDELVELAEKIIRGTS